MATTRPKSPRKTLSLRDELAHDYCMSVLKSTATFELLDRKDGVFGGASGEARLRVRRQVHCSDGRCSMSAQHTPGPWQPVSLLRGPGEAEARLVVRRIIWTGNTPESEYMLDEKGELATFVTLQEARAAIAKAAGSAA